MKLYHNKKDCTGCSACRQICVAGAISMKQDATGFIYPIVDEKKCVNCEMCKSVCPQQSNRNDTDVDKTDDNIYMGAQALDYDVRMSSSSGGMFTLLAKQILQDGGYVCAASICEDMVVRHIIVDNEDDIEKLKRTKYVQSDIGNCFVEIKKLLADKKVLFVGTPCQCEGLLRYLRKKYDNLYTVSLVCYGVPSPKVFSNYIHYIQKKYDMNVNSYYFRDKRAHDNGHTISFKGDKEISYELYKDPYCKLYFRNHIIRPSCFECRYCTTRRETDITIGDFWGIEKVKNEYDDGDGTSLMIIHSDHGKSLWNNIKEETRYFECGREDVLQPRLEGPVNRKKSKVYPFAGIWIRQKVFEYFSK